MTDLLANYRAVRALTEGLSAPLSAEDMCLQSMPDASPLKWHLAHTTWFFETFVLRRRAGYVPFDPGYEYLFNSYYNAVGDQYPRARRGLISRPGVAEVRAYRRHVDDAMAGVLSGAVDGGLADIVTLGLQHEQQHQELMVTDLKHGLSFNPCSPVACAPAPTSAGAAGHTGAATYAPLRFVDFPAGKAEVGARAEEGFSYDNERPHHPVWLAGFWLATRPVSVGEYLAFVEDGGYEQAALWLSDGWAHIQAEGISAPLYWRRGEQQWEQYSLGGQRPLVEAEPVCHLSYYEADAYARWADARLPTEQEWEHAARSLPVGGEVADELDPRCLHPRPLGAAQDGLVGMFGGVWEWTASAYLPYPGFRPFEGDAAEYNGKFMSGQMVLRGGSCATPPGHIRATYRNFFPPSARWQFSGLRLARDL